LQRGSAFCIREEDGPPGNLLLGGLLFSPKAPNYRIRWLAIAERARQQGYGARLLQHALAQVTRPATVSVVTFGPDTPGGAPARHLYMRFGFVPAEMTTPGPEGGSRQVFRLYLEISR
jgi:GNAT superfamily N-acetyltransferase